MSSQGINPLGTTQGISSIKPLNPAQKSGEFAKLIQGFGKEIDASQNRVAGKVSDLAAGKVDNVHQVVMELGKAEITFNYMMEVRNKMIDAYKEVMRMQM